MKHNSGGLADSEISFDKANVDVKNKLLKF